MLVPFGTNVVDGDGKTVGSVSRLVLHPETQQVSGLVVQQGVLDRREVVVPIDRVTAAGPPVRLAMRETEMEGLDLFHASRYREVPDHWSMPAGFDQRDFFLVGGGGWEESTLPFETTSPIVSGTPGLVRDRDTPVDPAAPVITPGTHVYDAGGQRVGDVESVDLDPGSGRIRQITVRRGFLFRKEVTIPAHLIGTLGDRITLNVGGDVVRGLEKG